MNVSFAIPGFTRSLINPTVQALLEVAPELFTIATLTGHAIRAMGPNYSALLEVAPELFTIATLTGHAIRAMGPNYSCLLAVVNAGDELGDVFEISNVRREDFDFHRGKSEYEDILQCNNLPSSATPRGHQTPAAFLIMASGLDQHGVDSEKPLRYSHIDIAGSSGPFPGIPTGAPILAMATNYILHRL
ncbi:UNVERIFIED_CONTAM: hypothetical protein FKN15_033844 [Acipenser sinensis]